jgi:hypothetical protein
MSTIDARTHLTWADELLDLLSRQQTMVDRLAELADSQAALIAASRTDELLNVLAQRQSLIDEFTASQSRLSVLTGHLDARLAQVEAPQREQIQNRLNAIGERLASVMRRDEDDQARLKAGRDVIRSEMSSMGAARQARHAYVTTPVAASTSNNRFADRRG